MFELVKKLFRPSESYIKKLKSYDIAIAGKKVASLSLNGNNLNLTIDPNFNLNVEMGELNVTTHGDFILDTWKHKFHLNSRKSIHIKDLPDAIAFRANTKRLIEKHKLWLDHHKEIVERIDKVVKDYEDEQIEKQKKICEDK